MIRVLSKWYHTGIVVGLLLTGFALATFFQWTFSVNLSRNHYHFVPYTAPDGTVLKFPQESEETVFSANSAPYREAPTIDLFEKKGTTE